MYSNRKYFIAFNQKIIILLIFRSCKFKILFKQGILKKTRHSEWRLHSGYLRFSKRNDCKII